MTNTMLGTPPVETAGCDDEDGDRSKFAVHLEWHIWDPCVVTCLAGAEERERLYIGLQVRTIAEWRRAPGVLREMAAWLEENEQVFDETFSDNAKGNMFLNVACPKLSLAAEAG